MIGPLGTYSLCAAVLVAAGGVLASLLAGTSDSKRAATAARWAVAVVTLLFTVAAAALLWALLDSQFRFSYVVRYTERALPLGYKIAAFWAGQEGSLLLWAWLLAVLSLIAVWVHRKTPAMSQAAFLATLLVVLGFFAALMLFAADPFAELARVPADGSGLNPMLQDPGMIAHPPLLFAGYAGFTIPFAMMFGALATSGSDDRWIVSCRRWLLASWVLLSVGIVLGAQWAYVELGWGGYWAWDPVENASLLPWLTSTALLHTLMMQARRGTFRIWNAGLIALTFILCIFGTYLTRSGVVGSVHSFGKSLVGNFFLVFLLLLVVISAAAILWRLRRLKADQPLAALLSLDGAFLAGNVLLLVIMLTTLVGTIFPLISGLFTKTPIIVTEGFYNTVVVPMGLLLLALMAVGPLLTAGSGVAWRLVCGLLLPPVAGVLAVVVGRKLGLGEVWTMVCLTGTVVAVTVVAVFALVQSFLSAWSKRISLNREGVALAAVRLVDGNHRRYGGQIAHLGMLLMAVGITGSSLFGVDQTFQLKPGEEARIGRYSLRMVALDEVRETNYIALQATVAMTDATGRSTLLQPQLRRYDKDRSNQANNEVALRTNLREDLYLTLVGAQETGQVTTIQARVNPLVIWIWIGGIVLTIGGLLCLLPRLVPQQRSAAAANAATSAAADTTTLETQPCRAIS